MSNDIEKKFVFGVSPPAREGDNATILIGIPAGAWEFIKDGKTNHVDLSKAVGAPLQIIIYGGKDHAECLKAIDAHNAALGVAALDKRGQDMGIKNGG